MPLISRIVVPVDFSPRCLAMMPYVKRLATHYHAKVVLMNVVMPFHMIYGTAISDPIVFPTGREFVEDQRKLMESYAVEELTGVPVERIVCEGDTVDMIVASAKEDGDNLVVMPTRGAGALRRFLLGSVASKVLHDVPCPVLTGAHVTDSPAPQDVPFKNVLCAVNLGPESKATLTWAAHLATDFKAKLSIIHVMSADNPGMTLSASPADRLQLESMVLQNLKALQKEAGIESAHLHAQAGSPARAINTYAESIGADLVVIGRGAPDSDQGRLATTAYAIIRESACPVISI